MVTVGVAAALAVTGGGGSSVRPAAAAGSTTVWAAGDIGKCGSGQPDDAVGKYLQSTNGTILVLGDMAYENGTASEFSTCFAPQWGALNGRIKPTPGNHEYQTKGAPGYYGYFGSAFGTATTGYYSFDAGSWHVIVLNSNCSPTGGCSAGSKQEKWLRADLAQHPAKCTLAYWHQPRFSSGNHGSNTSMTAFWNALYAANADVILGAHDHDYERFAPQTPAGKADSSRGIRQFVVGTGGNSLVPTRTAIANSQVRDAKTYGVLQLILGSTGYSWNFVKVGSAGSLADSGTGTCH
jgi:hypothetical protein